MKIIPALDKASFGKLKENNEGVVFSTYSQIATKLKQNEIPALESAGEKIEEWDFPRVKMIADWLGEDFDGVIVFDEAHKMKNVLEVKIAGRVLPPSNAAVAGVHLQNLLPNARIYYATATAATEAYNLAYLDRLGLWGEGTEFPSVSSFVNNIISAGKAGMELVSRDMKSQGIFASRALSYEGVKYEKVVHDLTAQQLEIYDTSAKIWQKAMKDMVAAFGKAMPGASAREVKKELGKVKSHFWGTNQRFYKLLMTSMQMPTVIKNMENDIANGDSVLVQITETNEAEQTRQIKKVDASEDLTLEDVDITPREMLINLLKKTYPIYVMDKMKMGSTVIWSPATDSTGKPIVDPQLKAERDRLIDQVATFQLPGNPLDMILDYFGTDKVSEVTGRSSRIVTKNGETLVESGLQRKKRAEIEFFRDGRKKILVYSKAGGTGEGYHAGLEFKNQDQRVHYVLSAGWSADEAMQLLGRSHRTNQKQPPIYKLVSSNISSQVRFTSTIARRLGQLGALTKGSRDAETGIFYRRCLWQSCCCSDFGRSKGESTK